MAIGSNLFGLSPEAKTSVLKRISAVAAPDTTLEREPEWVRRLNDRAARFLRLAQESALDVGGLVAAAIVPIITGGSIRAARLAQAMFNRGVNVQPILYPAVPEGAAG